MAVARTRRPQAAHALARLADAVAWRRLGTRAVSAARAGGVLLVVAAALAALPSSARANGYSVRACWTGYVGSGAWRPDGNGGAQINIFDACGNSDIGMGVANNPGPSSWLWQYGQWIFNAPPGATITGYHADVQVNNANNYVAKLVDSDNNHVLYCGGPSYACYWSTWLHRDIAVGNATQLRTLMQCSANACLSAVGSEGVYRQRNVTVDLDDPDAPGIDSYGGGLTGGWVRGVQGVGYNAWDPQSGVGRTWAEVDHAHGVVESVRGCDDRSTHPCPDGGASGSLDTNRLADGPHSLFVYATNGAGMTSGGHVATFQVDNARQGAPTGLAVSGGGAWRSSSTFTATYTAPRSTAPVSGATYEVCKTDGSSCFQAAAAVDGSQTLTMPSAGQWHVRVGNFTDAAGNGGDWSDWSDPMLFDPTAPQASAPQQANGWINKTEIGEYTVTLADSSHIPPSGIAGYAVTTDGTMPGTTITHRTDGGSVAATFALRGLPEGLTALRARAISGAGVPAGDGDVKSAIIRIDVTPPTARDEGAPPGSATAVGSGWQGLPAEVAFVGVDQVGLSGMQGASVGDPVESGAYIEYRVDGDTWSRVRGSRADLLESSPGDHIVDYRAVDLAGNVGSTHSLRIKIDPFHPGATVVHGAEWTSDTTFATDLELADPSAIGPSGLQGFAVTTDGTMPNETVATNIRGALRLTGLHEGITTIRARAISNAGLGATDSAVGTALVKVDRTAPAVSLSGTPPEPTTWHGAPVHLTIRAHDQPGLSGIAYIAYKLDDEAEHHVAEDGTPEATAALDVAADGVHTVTYWAVDEAGNIASAKSAAFRLQVTPPLGGLLPIDPTDPTRLDYVVVSACIKSASVQIRPSGGTWKALETEIHGDHLIAHVPDQAYAAGNYDTRAVVVDCAGNQAILDRWWEGANAGLPAVLHLPLRISTVLRASFETANGAASKSGCRTIIKTKVVRSQQGKKRVRRAKVRVCPDRKRAKSKSRVHGRLRATGAATRKPVRKNRVASRSVTGLGRAKRVFGMLTTSDGRPVPHALVQAQVQIKDLARWDVVGAATTGADGVVTMMIPPGPSRRVRLSYAGTEVLLDVSSASLFAPVSATSTIGVDRSAVRNGQTVTFTGRLLGGFVPASGRELELDGYNPVKHRWVPVQTKGLRTASSGRWRAKYRFTATRRATTYRFRVRISGIRGFPFEEGYSPALAVTVYP